MTPRLWWLGAVVGAGLIAADVAGQLHQGVADARLAAFVGASALVFAAACALSALRPESWVGPLLLVWAAAAILDDLPTAYPYSSPLLTLGLVGSALAAPVFAHVTLSYPSGRLGSWPLRVFVALVYVVSLAREIPFLLYFDYQGCAQCAPYVNSVFFRGDPGFSFVDWSRRTGILMLALTFCYCVLLAYRLRRAPRGAWRTLLPLVVASLVGAITFGTRQVALATAHFGWLDTIDTVGILTAVAVPLALVVGVLSTRHARGPVGGLVLELGHVRPGGVRDALARAVGDPTLEIALWLPARGEWVDEQGRAVDLPEGPERAVTLVSEGGGPVAAIVHDAQLSDQRGLIHAAGSVARLALENERLHAELRLQLAELRASRTRIVRATDAERRRLERDLHDGVQQRLLGLALVLQMLETRVDERGEALELVGEAETELKAAVRELREFARGIHPAVLSDQGLAAATRTLAVRSPIPVEIDATAERLPAVVETAAYFTIAECLANVAKYAKATRAWVTVQRVNGRAVVEVGDDGVGGADPNRGSGLRGLADRVDALDGSLRLESPPGGGTRIVAEIPCA
jgi:signal transduction histidine kinase